MTVSKCTYKFRSGETCGEKCNEDVHETPPYRIRRVYIECGEERFKEEEYDPPPYCILHLELPIYADDQYKKITLAKEAKITEKIDPKNRDFNFESAKITSINLSKRQDIFDLNFADTTIDGYTPYDPAADPATTVIDGSALFDGATIEGPARFEGITIRGYASFNGVTIRGDAKFNGATFEGNASFERIAIDGDIEFLEAEISYRDGLKIIKQARLMREANFKKAVIKGDALFDKAIIDGGFACYITEIGGKLSLENTMFTLIESQEEAFRKAKQVREKLGDRKKADDYFYKEMVAKREQKAQPIKFLEQLIIQYALGYGVYPLRMMYAWIVIALAMGAFLTGVTGDINDLPFGISAAFIPGYGISLSHVFSGVSLWIIRIEALVSEFFVAAFIVVFSRKFMR